MDDSRLKFGVGVLVIAAIGIGIILTFLFGAVPTVFTREFRLLVAFPDADGISTNTPVLLRGVEIGRVIEKKLREDDVLLTLGIESRYQDNLTHEYLPRIGTGSVITGDSKLEFVKADDDALQTIHGERLDAIRKQTYSDEQFLSYGRKSGDPFDLLFTMEDEMRNTLRSVQSASGAIQNVGGEVSQLISDASNVVGGADDQVDELGQEAREALQQFQRVMRDIAEIIEDQQLRENLGQAVAELPEVLNEAQTTLQSTQKTFESFEQVGQRFERVGAAAEKTVQNVDRTVDSIRDTVRSADNTIQNLEQITQPIAENSEALVQKVLKSLDDIDRTLIQVETFGTALNNSNGTLRRLLEDDDLYFEVRRTVENIEQATARLRPILDDVRIFSDKIARDPRQLGVRGALDKRPSGVGLK
jgi:phospholipid/cholesterol/gamma-HCH transport system substrate-binding protein